MTIQIGFEACSFNLLLVFFDIALVSFSVVDSSCCGLLTITWSFGL